MTSAIFILYFHCLETDECRMFRVSLHEERSCIFHAVLHDVGRVKAGRPCWIKCILLWFNPCPSSRIFFGDSTMSSIFLSHGS